MEKKHQKDCAWEKSKLIHVLPIKDIFPHKEEGTDCPCIPKIQSGDGEVLYQSPIIIHNAWDKRK